MSGYAWVTLATNNAYSLGALVLAHSLKKQKTAHKLAVLITPAVSPAMREQLQTVFDLVKVVDVLDSKDEAHLALMKRPDLGITFTKIHCWRLVEFEKCVFLDADTLVVRNCDELFEREEFSAAPDVSWPDCFNSGVFVYRPSVETFNKILQFAVENRSFDGGDQGLLNQYFSDWATEDIKKHLPFVYNLTSVAAYSYIPAFKHYGAETRIVHFIGAGKPWLQQLDVATKTVTPTSGSEHLAPLLQQWWDLFCEKVHPNLDKNLESSNDGMSHTPVEACSNSLPNALIDESQTPHLIEPCTPYREKDDFRQYNLPYQPFDVKGSSGELLNVEFLLASVVPPKAPEVSLDEQQRLEEDKMEEKDEAEFREEEKKEEYEKPDGGLQMFQDNSGCQNNGPTQQLEISESKIEEEEEEEKQNLQQQEEQQKQEEPPPPPPKDPFDYNSFFPDETCINNYLERNIETYHPFENHSRQEDIEKITDSESDHEQSVPPLPRFLTIPEDDRRQSGNVDAHPPEEHYHSSSKPTQDSCPIMEQVHIPEQAILPRQQQREPPREDVQPEPLVEKRELTKSKSMPYLPFDVTTESSLPPARSIWKSQPDVNAELNRKYSMPKLKPLLPKQNSFSKSLPSAMPKVTLYTEFLMSSEYKDPDDLPKDKVGFVETQIHKEAKLRRGKSKVDLRGKFGPLPYASSPEIEKPVIPKKVPFQPLGNELYDLTQCKRQMGNKPKSKDGQRRKENIRSLPALKPIVPASDKKSTLGRKRKSKELSPGTGGRGKIPRTEPKSVKQRKREAKVTPRNVSAGANSNDLDEILNRLREFSKDYQHFFGPVPETKKKTVKCKNTTVQASDQNDAECSMSEAFEMLSTPTRTRSKETQTPKEDSRGSVFEGLEFLTFRNYLKNQKEASEKGLINIRGILSDSSRSETEVIKSSVVEDGKGEVADGIHCAADIINRLKIGGGSIRLTGGNIPLKEQDASVHSVKVHSEYQNLPAPIRKGCDLESSVGADSNQRQTKSSRSAESVGESTNDLDQSDKVETNGGIEETVQSRQFSLSTAPFSKMGKSKDSAGPDKMTSLNSKKQKEESTNGNEEETNKGELHTKGSQMIRKDEGGVIHAKECSESTEVIKTPVPNSSVDLKLYRKDASNAVSLRPKREVQRTRVSEKDCNESIHNIAEQRERETTSEGATADPEPVSCRQEMRDDESRRTLRAEAPTKTLASVISSPATSQTDQSSRVTFSGEAGVNEGFAERKTQSDVGDTINADATVTRNPENTLCVPDFDTPRSSRVTHSPTVASASVEEMNKTESPTSQRPELQKAGKNPANGLKNGQITENRFDLPSNNSPDGTVRFENKKTPDKKSGMQTPFSPSLSTPEKGNTEPENPEDLMNTSGIAGAIAQLSLEAGSGQSPESAATSTAHQEYIRRQNWETGNMDYMGKDSFDNIWSKICQTIEAKETEVGGTSENSTTMKTNAEKPKETPPAERAASLSSTLQKCPEYIETLPGEPPAGPVEDDEIIFSKPENKQSCLTNIVEEEEVGIEGSGGTVPALVKGGVKLSDILNPTVGGISHQTEKPQPDVRAPEKKVQESMEKGQTVSSGGKSQSSLETTAATKPIVVPTGVKTPSPVAAPAEAKPQAPTSPAEIKPQLAATPAEAKPQAPTSPAEIKLQLAATPAEAKPQLAATPAKAKPQAPSSPAEAKPQAPNSPAEAKPQAPTSPAEAKPQTPTSPAEVKPQLAATPAEFKPGAPHSAQEKPQAPTSAEVKPQPVAATPAEVKPQTLSSPAETKSQPAPSAQAKPQPAATPAEAKPQAPSSPAEVKPQPVAATPAEFKPEAPHSAQAKPQAPTSPAEVKPQAPSSLAEAKPQAAPSPAEAKPQAAPSSQAKHLPAAASTEKIKPQSDCKTTEIHQPPATSPQCPSSDAPKQPETAVKDESQEAKPMGKAEECKTVAIMPPSVFPGIQTTGKGKKRSKGKKAEEKSPESLEPIPLPAPDSETFESGPEPSNQEGKQKKGVFSKILEIVGVTPKEKNENEISKSVFYDVEKGVPAVEVGEEMIKQVLEGSEKPLEGAVSGPVVETKQSTGDKPEKKTPPLADSQTGIEFPAGTLEEKKTDAEVEDPEVKQSGTTEEQKPQAKGNEKSGSSEGKHKNRGKKQKSGQQSMPKPARNSSPKELKEPKDVTDTSATKQKPPSPKLTMPQKLPETEVTTPTPPPHPDVPPRRNSALLLVDDSILETPPVPEPPKESAEEAVKGKVSTEIEGIIDKAKSEVESLLQGRRSVEKESGEGTDLINTMKLMMGEEQPPKEPAGEVEELRVTSEEERKKQKGSKSSKLSDQILKAIPPPRRKAISEASASTSGIPAAPAAPEQKTSAEENKGKTAKPSSIPVPPPRSRGKPSQPAPPKGKAKK